jgi:hypothetical protein
MPGTLTHGSTQSFRWVWSDINGNPPTADGTGDSISVNCGNTNCVALSPPAPILVYKGQNVQIDYNNNSPTGLLPYVSVPIQDAHALSCKQDTPPCQPQGFNVELSITRQLDSNNSASVAEDWASAETGTFD